MTTENIRLACANCDRDDKDGITPDELERCIAQGWADIEEVQSYEESIKTYERLEDAPPSFRLMSWHTHIGTCPECREE